MADFSHEFFQPLNTRRFAQSLNTVIAKPLAADKGNVGDIPLQINPKKLNYTTGFPSSYEVSPARDGKALTVKDLNDVAFLATVGGFLGQIGYRPTFSPKVCKEIGGYPKGTILTDFSHIDESADSPYAIVREVISLQDNNKQNFVYDEETNPKPYVIGSTVDDKVWWDYVYKLSGAIDLFAPDYSLVKNLTTFSTEQQQEFAWQSNIDGWLYITVEATSDMGFRQKAQGSSSIASNYKAMNYPEQLIEVYTPIANYTEDRVNSVYYFGYGADTSWEGRRSKSDTTHLIYSTLSGTKYGGVFPTNNGSWHKLVAYVADESNHLTISINELVNHFQKWSEME